MSDYEYKQRDSGWTYFYPDDGETAEDAREDTYAAYVDRAADPESVTRRACEYDWSDRDGWERKSEEPFPIIVVSPKGEEFSFDAWHEPTVDFCVREKFQ